MKLAAIIAGTITGTGVWQSGVPPITLESSSAIATQTASVATGSTTEMDLSSTDAITVLITSESSTTSRGHGSGFWTGSDPFSFVPPSTWSDTASSTKSKPSSPSSSSQVPNPSSEDNSTSTSLSQSQSSAQPASTSTYITYVTAGGGSSTLTPLTGASTGATATGSSFVTSTSAGQSNNLVWSDLVFKIVAAWLMAQRVL